MRSIFTFCGLHLPLSTAVAPRSGIAGRGRRDVLIAELTGAQEEAAVDPEDLSGHISRRVGAEVEHRAGDVVGVADSADRGGRREGSGVVRQLLPRPLNQDRAGRDRVDGDAERPQFDRQPGRQHVQAALGGVVRRRPLEGAAARAAGDVDDPPPALLAHQPRRRLSAEENALEVGAAYQEVFVGGDRFEPLKAEGARVQRPLWASTGVKNPEYSTPCTSPSWSRRTP